MYGAHGATPWSLLHLNVVDSPCHIVLDGRHQVVVHLVGLPLEGNQGVLVSIGPQADPLPQAVQIGEVPNPKVIHRSQQDESLDLAHHLRT
jgi:hypothetical protein